MNKNSRKLAEIVVIANKGKSHDVARVVMKQYTEDTRNITTTIDRKCNVIVSFVYGDKQELQDIIQDIKSVAYVKSVVRRA